MTMHAAKGLQASVVFIPGLEDEILPGPRRAAIPGLVLEGARLLYVSLTRARTAVIITLATNRFWLGSMQEHSPSRYASHLAGPFRSRASGLTAEEAATIASVLEAMTPPPTPVA